MHEVPDNYNSASLAYSRQSWIFYQEFQYIQSIHTAPTIFWKLNIKFSEGPEVKISTQ